MESEHLGSSIALEESDFDNLSFPLVSDGSVTTDGSLLSGITTDTIRDDLSQQLSSEHQVHAVSNNIAGGTQLSELFTNDHIKSMTLAYDVMLTNEPQTSTLYSWQNDCSINASSNQKSKMLSTFEKSNSTASTVSAHMTTNVNYGNPSHLAQPKRKNYTNVSVMNQNLNKTSHTITASPLQASQPFTLKVPIQTSLGKNLQLHLVTKGGMPVAHNPQVTSTIPLNTICQQTLQPEITPQRTSSLVLIKDKSTGKSFLVPSGSPLLLTQPHPVTIQPLDSQATMSSEISLPEVPSSFGGIDILDPQPVIDVNEFLNIPPKVTETESNVDFQLSDKANLKTDTDECQDSNNHHGTVQSMVNSNLSSGGIEAEINGGSFDEKMELTDTDLQETGEDLIKLLAVKISDRKADGTGEENVNVKQYLTGEDCNELDNVAPYEVDIADKIGQIVTPITTRGSGKEEIQMDSSITETEERIASIVPDSMRDFVRDIFEDEDALDKEYIQAIMDETVGPMKTDGDLALLPSDIAKHAVEKLSQSAENIGKLTSARLQIDKSQLIVVNGQNRWKCNICPKMYSTKHNLVSHILDHYDIKPHCCVRCGKLFKQPSHLYTHMLTHKTVKPYTCKICNRAFTQPSHLKRHSAVHLDKRPHVCDICQQGFSFPNELKSHKERHKLPDQTLECDQCGEAFESTRKLKSHVASQHKESTDLTCKDCGKVCVYPSQLRDHMLKHSGTRPFICTECGMDFLKEHHLKAHQFTHTGQQPFTCDVCSRSFNQKANLQRHYLIHDKSKKFKCPECGREFSQPQVLKSHIQTHNGKKPFKCKECGKTFSRQHNLNGHMTLHQGDKRYVCFCSASFTLKGNLNRHMKTKHNMEPTDEPPPSEDVTAAEVEEMAPETAAQILNMMSAKGFLLSAGQPDNLMAQDDDPHHIKNKRKSVPRKSIMSDDNNPLVTAEVQETSESDLMQFQTEGMLTNNNDIVDKSIPTNPKPAMASQDDAVSPAKRKQLNPQFIQCKTESDIKKTNVSSGMNTSIPGSTRRKQKAVVRTDLIHLDPETEVQDEAEQVWQGTTSRDGMENSNSMDNVENANTRTSDITKNQTEGIPPLLTVDLNSTVINTNN